MTLGGEANEVAFQAPAALLWNSMDWGPNGRRSRAVLAPLAGEPVLLTQPRAFDGELGTRLSLAPYSGQQNAPSEASQEGAVRLLLQPNSQSEREC